MKDRDMVICVKPVGMSAEDGPGSLPEALGKHLGGPVFPIHRLDLNVGGIMVYARTSQAAAKLSQAVREGLLVKEYLALVHGCPSPASGILQDLLWKDSRKNKVFVVSRPRKGAREALLAYQVLETQDARALIHIRLYTGRSHQIRVQFASRRYPLVGDHKYGSRGEERAPALWSCRLSLPHPRTGAPLSFFQGPKGIPWEAFAESGKEPPEIVPLLSRS